MTCVYNVEALMEEAQDMYEERLCIYFDKEDLLDDRVPF